MITLALAFTGFVALDDDKEPLTRCIAAIFALACAAYLIWGGA